MSFRVMLAFGFGVLALSLVSCSSADDGGKPSAQGGNDRDSGVDSGLDEDGVAARDAGGDRDAAGTDDGGASVGCENDGDCDPGYLCDSVSHLCYFVGCDRDSDCPAGKCRRATAQCVECILDEDCGGGTCDADKGLCRRGLCSDDPLEQNDTARAPAALAAGGAAKLTLCSGDSDWFALGLSAGAKLSVEFSSASVVAVPLALFASDDPGGTALVTANASQAGEIVLSKAPSAGDYLLSVGPVDREVSYTLDVEVTAPASACQDDLLEDNDSIGQARPVSAGSFPNMLACPDDPDFFAVSLNSGDLLDAAVEGAGISLGLLSVDGAVSEEGQGSPPSLTFEAAVSGVYYLRASAGSGKTAAYTLTVDITPGVKTCSDDSYEDNDGPAAAAALPANSTADLLICPGDDDWFRLSPGGLPLSVAVSGDAPPKFEIYGIWDTANPIAWSDADPADRRVQRAAVEKPPAEVLLRVPSAGDGISYEAGWSVERPACQDDRFEENDSAAAAALVAPGPIDDAVICPGDEDWFGVSLNKGDTVSVTVVFDNAGGDLDAVLLGPDGKEVASSLGTGDTEEISYTATGGGVHAFAVFGWDGAAAPYLVDVAIEEAPEICADDTMEENDSVAAAVFVPSGTTAGLVLCPGDDDWFRVHLESGDEVLAAATLAATQSGDFGVSIHYPSGIIVLDLASGVGHSHLVGAGPVNTAGDYTLRVTNRGQVPLSYDLEVLVTGAGGKTGKETKVLSPGLRVDEANPVLVEIAFERVPQSAFADSLTVGFVVEHARVSDLVISAVFGSGPETALWSHLGGATDGGKDGDQADDADVEFYSKKVTLGAGAAARDSLFFMIEDTVSGAAGTVVSIDATLKWHVL